MAKLTDTTGMPRYATEYGEFLLHVDRAGNPTTFTLEGEPLVSGCDKETALQGTAVYLQAKATGDEGIVINSGKVGGKL